MIRKHKRRAIRNLIVTVLCLLLVWAESGYPLPTQRMSFRRAERQMLVDRSAVIWTDRELAESLLPTMLVGETSAAFHVYGQSWLTVCPRLEGGTPVLLPEDLPNQQGGSVYQDLAILVPDPPEGAVSARMTLSTGPLYPLPENAEEELETYTLIGTPTERMFLLQPEHQYILEDDSTEFQHQLWSDEVFHLQSLGHFLRLAGQNENVLDGLPYTLEFFDANGIPIP